MLQERRRKWLWPIFRHCTSGFINDTFSAVSIYGLEWNKVIVAYFKVLSQHLPEEVHEKCQSEYLMPHIVICCSPEPGLLWECSQATCSQQTAACCRTWEKAAAWRLSRGPSLDLHTVYIPKPPPAGQVWDVWDATHIARYRHLLLSSLSLKDLPTQPTSSRSSNACGKTAFCGTSIKWSDVTNRTRAQTHRNPPPIQETNDNPQVHGCVKYLPGWQADAHLNTECTDFVQLLLLCPARPLSFFHPALLTKKLCSSLCLHHIPHRIFIWKGRTTVSLLSYKHRLKALLLS
jgi:hypothetical protein